MWLIDSTSTIKSYKQINGDLKSLAAVSMYMEDIAKKTNQICKEIIDVLAHYDGIQLDLRQSEVSVDKSLVVHFFKVSWSTTRVYYNTKTSFILTITYAAHPNNNVPSIIPTLNCIAMHNNNVIPNCNERARANVHYTMIIIKYLRIRLHVNTS